MVAEAGEMVTATPDWAKSCAVSLFVVSATASALIWTAVVVTVPLPLEALVPAWEKVNVVADGTLAMVNVPLKLASVTPEIVTGCPVKRLCAAVVVIVTTLFARTAPLLAMLTVLAGGRVVLGAVYNPSVLIVPEAAFPPSTLFTNHFTVPAETVPPPLVALVPVVATCTLPLAMFVLMLRRPPRGTWAAFGETVTVTALLPPPPPQPHSARAATPAAATNVLRMCPTFIPVPP